MTTPAPNALAPLARRPLTPAQFETLADVPPEIEWFANLTNTNTRRAYRQDLEDFMAFAGLRQPEQFRDVTRAHVIAWRDQLVRQELANDTIRRKLAALSSLYAYLCDRNAVLHNSVLGVKRPCSMNREGVTPALGDHQARLLLGAPPESTLKGRYPHGAARASSPPALLARLYARRVSRAQDFGRDGQVDASRHDRVALWAPACSTSM
jgi:hypothetical protein